MQPFFSDREIRGTIAFLLLFLLFITGLALLHAKIDPAQDPQAAIEAEARARSFIEANKEADTLRLAPFDPNTVTYEELRAFGLSKKAAVGLLKYRNRGKIFGIPEDVACCYDIDDSLFRLLAPYIRIDSQYAVTPRTFRSERGTNPPQASAAFRSKRVVAPPQTPTAFRLDTVSARYLRAIGALSKRQAEVFIRWRDSHGIYDIEELRECYVIDDSLAAALAPYIIFPERQAPAPRLPIELNEADSATLRAVAGIGEKTVERILAYRRQLGGFVRVEQLAEIPGVTETNYEKILRQICCDSCKIRKIDINFAPKDVLAQHPYITLPALRKLLKKRQLKGGWRTAQELFDDDIFRPEEAARLAPYLQFGTPGDTGSSGGFDDIIPTTGEE